MTPAAALDAVRERPATESIFVAGRKLSSFGVLQKDVGKILVNIRAGQHLRFADDEDLIKALLKYHPDADRLLEECMAIKIDNSPIDDDVRCVWVVKFDGE